jgi:hypothetical protein
MQKKMLPDLYLENPVSVHTGDAWWNNMQQCKFRLSTYIFVFFGAENSSPCGLLSHMNARLLIYLLVLSAYKPCFD